MAGAAADRIYRALLASVRFFSRGWGSVESYQSLLRIKSVIRDREQCAQVVARHQHPVTVKKIQESSECTIYNGQFLSPLASFLPGILPRESEVARFEMLVPRTWESDATRPMYIQLAGTGDHFFWRRRRMMALPLIAEAKIGSVLLENPFYGSRKPRDQVRSQLHCVSDLFVMGLALILECMLLSHWLEDQDLGPVGLTGISMGGHNASLSACVWPKPVVVVPCLSWSTASCVFTEGVLSRAVAWDKLEEQLFRVRVGQDEERRTVFQEVMKMDREAELRFANNPADLTTLLYMNSSEGAEDDVGGLGVTHALPANSPAKGRRKDIGRKKRSQCPQPETVDIMRSVLDFATHLHNYPMPLSPELAIFIAAKEDLYIPRQCVKDVRSLWPGCEVRYINGGHVSTTILQQAHFRRALIDGMRRLQESRL